MNQELDRFTKYVNLYQKLVIAVAAKTVDHQTAEDIAQDVFLKMLDYLEYLKDETVRAWLIVVTKNLVTDYLKKGGNNSIYPMEPESIAEHIVNTFDFLIAFDDLLIAFLDFFQVGYHLGIQVYDFFIFFY